MVLLPLGVALVLATFRVVATMLRGGTWHRWVHGIAFLLIIAMGLLAPLTVALAGAGNPAWRPIGVVSFVATVLFVVFLFLPWGNASFLMAIVTSSPGSLRLPYAWRPTNSDSKIKKPNSLSAFALAWTDQTGLVRERTTACTRLYRSSFAKILLDHLGRIG